jgi:hypothetical protein
MVPWLSILCFAFILHLLLPAYSLFGSERSRQTKKFFLRRSFSVVFVVSEGSGLDITRSYCYSAARSSSEGRIDGSQPQLFFTCVLVLVCVSSFRFDGKQCVVSFPVVEKT